MRRRQHAEEDVARLDAQRCLEGHRFEVPLPDEHLAETAPLREHQLGGAGEGREGDQILAQESGAESIFANAREGEGRPAVHQRRRPCSLVAVVQREQPGGAGVGERLEDPCPRPTAELAAP